MIPATLPSEEMKLLIALYSAKIAFSINGPFRIKCIFMNLPCRGYVM